MLSSAIKYKETGNRLVAQNRYQEALEQYELAIECDPTLAAAWLNKGIMLKKLGNNDQAILAFEKALELDENYHKARENLATLLLVQKKYVQAWPHLYKLNPLSKEMQLGRIKCQQVIGAKIIFANVDLKWTNDNTVKILEFGEGMASGFSGFDILSDNKKSISGALTSELCELIPPIRSEGDNFLYPIFLNCEPGSPFSSAIIDEKLEQFTKDFKSTVSKKTFSPEKVSNYCAIYGGNSIIPTPPTILKLGDATANFVFENKAIMHRCFINAGLINSRPATLILPRQYHSDLYSQIIIQLPSVNRFVLKIPDKERGEGVVIVSKKELDQYLKILLCPNHCLPARSVDFRDYMIKETSASLLFIEEELKRLVLWRNSGEPEFMVEAYVNSKPVTINKNVFDGTMRVAFILVYEEENFRFIPLGAYWKLPPKPIIQNVPLRESCVSSFSEDHLLSALPDSGDEKEVLRQLSELLPKLFRDILRFDTEKYICQFPQNSDEERLRKAMQWLKLSNDYVKHGQLVIAHHYLEGAKDLIPTNSSYYHQLGIYYHANKQYDEAINAFDSALKENPQMPATFFRRGCSWLKKNDTHSAILDFKKAAEFNPEYKKITACILSNYLSENEVKQNEQFNPWSSHSSYRRACPS